MIQSIINFFENIGRCRAAAEFARMGRHDLARELMLRK